MMWENIERFDDENVAKFVFTNQNAVAESVLYRYPDYLTRTVICCSTQSGCPIGCRFCGSGDYFVRNLTTEEIVKQVSHCLKETKVPPREIKKLQIMFMSMGEPLLNFTNLSKSLVYLNTIYPNADLLISTMGPKIDYFPLIKLSFDIPKIGLQFSIHESTDEARNKLIPFKNKISLSEIADIGSWWNNWTGRKPFINYCAHDENSSENDATRLAKIFNPSIFCATVSVICERSEGLTKTNVHQKELASTFAEKLINKGFDVRVFDPSGQDTIGGGCGQLFYVQQWMKNNPELSKPSAGNGLHIVHMPANE